MFFPPGLVYGGTEGVESHFHVLRTQTRFRRYRGRRILFSFFTPGLIFGNTEGGGSSFHALRSRTHFQQCLVRRVSFSCFMLPDSFSAVLRAPGTVFMFCEPGLIFGGTEGVVSRFLVLRARTPFRLYRGRRVPFSCFALPDSFSAVPRASGHVFMFCAHGLVFGGIEGVGSRFLILRARTHFRRYRGRRVPFSCFVLPDSFSAVPRASGPNIMFCAPGLIFGGVECVGSRFHVLRAQTRVCRVPRA
jgi:hypothetical protein